MAERGELTRQKLIDTALRLFRDDGYHATTMRRIATEAGVSLGNAYYYFASKDDLVHELYRRVQRDHRDRALPLLRPGAALATNLRITLHAGLDVMAPYQGFGSTVRAGRPAGLLHGQPVLGRVDRCPRDGDRPDEARGADLPTSAPPMLQDRLPTLLWLAYLAITLHWVSDRSPGQARTRALVDRAAPLIGRLVNLARLPGSGRLVAEVNALMDIAVSDPSVAEVLEVSR